MAGHFVPVYPFWTILSMVPSYNRLYNVIWPSNPGYRHIICGDITDNGRYMIQNIIFGNCGTFCHGLPFSDHFDKGTPSRFLAKMSIFDSVPRNLIMSKVQREIIFAHSSHRLIACYFEFNNTTWTFLGYIFVLYYNIMGVSLKVILYSTTHASPQHVLAHTCQSEWRHIWLFQSPPHISVHSLIS